MQPKMSKEISASEAEMFEFHKIEYERLTSEVHSRQIQSGRIETATVVALASYYAFLFSIAGKIPVAEPTAVDMIFSMPGVFAFVMVVKSAYNYLRIFEIAEYLSKIESVYKRRAIIYLCDPSTWVI